MNKGLLADNPLREKLAALSVGIDKEGMIIADLNYIEDSSCEADINIVMTESGRFVEVQGTAEGEPFSRAQLDAILECGETAMKSVFKKQNEILG